MQVSRTLSWLLPHAAACVRPLALTVSRSFITLSTPDTADVEGIAVLTLSRPEAKNALSLAVIDSLQQHAVELSKDQEIRCVLVTSSTPGIFCAGADLKERIKMSPEQAAGAVSKLRSVFDEFSRLQVPTIAVVEGGAFGGGAELALACDLRIGGPAASFSFPETRLGILPGAGGTQRLPRLIGPARAKELIFTGRRLDAEAALATGLLNHLCQDPMGDALRYANEICEGGPIGIRMAKRAIHEGLGMDMPQALEVESRCYSETLKTEDRLEGLRAFQEKRKPVFKGH